jgi:hypothetical protein
MKRFSLLLISIVFFNALQAQMPRFNKRSKIDTLAMSISFSDSINDQLQSRFLDSFNESVSDFNQQSDKEFFVVLDSSKVGDYVHVDVGKIRYSTIGRSIWVSLLDVGLLAADIALINTGWPPIFLPILTPAVRSNIQLNMSDGVVDNNNKLERLLPLPSGYFVGIEKQNERFDRKLGQNIDRFLKKLNKRQKKNSS